MQSERRSNAISSIGLVTLLFATLVAAILPVAGHADGMDPVLPIECSPPDTSGTSSVPDAGTSQDSVTSQGDVLLSAELLFLVLLTSI